ncbi:ABC transporter permease [Desulfomarina profundi]|uniref:ABC transporter permease n=1 Tax=Desulfomarina profundi TaxID=2772557 RepID=A0A8D5FXI3_9BACT|nr:ABC transporter permease [Desulfomarina profundi]BCL61787.1 ABC transporter permease [Desulfomarina profundi]
MNYFTVLLKQSKSLSIFFLIALVFMFGALAQSSGLIGEFLDTFEDWNYLLKQNVQIVLASGFTATILGIASGILMTRPWFKRYAEVFSQSFNILSAVPTLAVLAIIMTITGIGFKSAFIGLVTVTILPVVRNTYQGISEVPDHMIEAARGQGMTDKQVLWKVQIPNALYVISAGIRTGFALNVGTSPLITLIAADSLGEYIFTGIMLNEFNSLLIGSFSIAALAIVTDFILSRLQFWLLPKGINPQRFT